MAAHATESSTLPTYQDFVAHFRLEDVAKTFSGDFKNGINAVIECCDRHAEAGRMALN